MIKQETIDEVRARMDTLDVLQEMGVVFKKQMACCPFHKEKSASFHLWRRQNIYKCFGCGKSGDAITFLVEHEKKTFNEAIEWLAQKYNVAVEYDQQAQQETEEKKDARREQAILLDFAHRRFEEVLHNMPADSDVWNYLLKRGYTPQMCKQWSLGYAPDDWRFLTGSLINMGKYQPALDLGLVVTKEEKNFDFFRNRIMIPIHNSSGQLIGFGGRAVGEGQVKYLNSKESLLYQKQNVWFGLDKAAKAIRSAGYAYVEEGYFDVMSWHNAGICNTVAGCGTEITEKQIRLLRRHCDHAVLAMDGDNAGTKKSMSLVNAFLKCDFKVEIIPFPDQMDPDEYKINFFQNESAAELAGAECPGS